MKRSAYVTLLIHLLFVVSSSAQVSPFWTGTSDPRSISFRITQNLLNRKEFMLYNSPQLKTFHYAEACAAFGAARIAGLLKDTVTIKRLAKRYEPLLDGVLLGPGIHVDVNVYGIVPLELFRYTHDERFRKQGLDLADEQWKNPQPDGLTNQTRYWIDDMYMIGSLQVQAYRITGNSLYIERAAKELDAYLKKLQQPNGLFFHGPEAPFHWGRGNGWVAAALAELLSELPRKNPYYKSIHIGYVKMMNALLQYQADDGMWRQLIDYPNAWKETSSTAMFGYAMMVGVKKGILPAKKFRPATEKAWLALTGYLNDNGELTDVCVGTGQSKDPQYYLDRGRSTGDFHGQAPMLWFAYSLLYGY
ncbi:MAG TPA: glycoside hydrolase family 88 protein [Ohtaekwangia sp.]